jgi:8-amino-7-oxononanoate synthase
LEIAIVGLGCRFPGARDPLAYWELIRSGTVAFRHIPPSRWDHSTFYDPTTRVPDKAYVDKGAYLEDEELREFASLHYGIAPRRVQVTDPQHRLLLDSVRAALQDAGYEKRPFEHTRTGVFVGASVSEHKEVLLSRVRVMQFFDGAFGRALSGPEAEKLREALIEHVVPMRAFSMPGNLLNMAAAVVAQTWDLRGPALSIDAACSSALVAAQQAIVNLRGGQIDLAIAGGVYLNLLPDNLVCFSRIGAISRTGECRPFDATADGFLMGEGAGAVILKRLDDALRDGDRVYAIVKGASANNDGRAEGPMTPRQGGQLEALRMAYRDAGVAPTSVGYVEAHGTATAVGDVVEIGALRALFDEAGWTARDGARTALGSVKANIGHTMSASGIAGLIKATLALHHRKLPPQPGVAEENPELELATGPFFLPKTELSWESDGQPRRAGVSSFGFGGTNAHLVLEQAPEPAAPRRRLPAPRKPRAELFMLAGARASVVARFARLIAAALPALRREGRTLADVAYTLSQRAHGDARLAVAADSFEALAEKLLVCADELEKRGDGAPDPMAPPDVSLPAQLVPGAVFAQGPFQNTKVALLFPGQGAQKVGLLREMYEQVPAFRGRLDQLDDAIADLHPRLGGSLRSFLYAEPSVEAERRLMQTEVCQPAMAALGLALHALLEKLGARGDVAVGHSLGEFAAAGAAGVLSAEDAVRLVAMRGLAMVDLGLPDTGKMVSAAASAEEVTEALRGIDGVGIANLNHPKQTVVSGTSPAVKAASEKLQGRGIEVTPLEVSHAFHSPLMAGIAQTMRELVAKIAVAPGGFPVVSAITARPYAGDAREIWVRHATAPLDFLSALRSVSALGARIFVQVGAGGVLTSFVRATLPQGERTVNVGLASREEDGLLQLAVALGHLWAAGIGLEAAPLFEGRDARLITLPPTPLDTQPYWPVERPRTPAAPVRLPSAAQEMTEMDPLVALFREQVALLQQQAKVLEQQAAALAGKGISLPSLPAMPQAASAAAPVPVPPLAQAAPLQNPPAAAAKEAAASDERVGKTILASVARISAFPLEAIKPSQTLAGDLGFDSLMTVELDADVNKAFPGAGGLPRNLLGLQTTVQDIIDHVARSVAQPHAPVAPVLSPILGEMASEGRELKPFAPAFVEAALAATAEDPLPRRILITRDSLGVADALAKMLNDGGHDAVVGEPGDPLAGIGGIIHLAPLGRAASELEPGFGAVLEAHRIARAQAASKAGGMFVVATAGADEIDAALAGYAKALARERSDELVKSVEMRTSDGADAMAHALLAELRSGNAAPEVRWAGGTRYEPDLQPAVAGEPVEIGSGDVVLVTGGTRGIGLKLAQALSAKGAAIALAGRTPPALLPERAVFVQWDVTRPPGAALDEARAKLGKFTALVHAAGITEDGPVTEANDESVERVLATKVSGFWSAVLATMQDPIRSVVALASWAGRFGNAGQTSYSAANAALSRAVVALARKRPGVRALSLEYPPWDGTAMVAKIPPLARSALAEQGVPFIDDAAGLAAFFGGLRAGWSGPVLLAHDRPARRVAHRLRVQVSRTEHPYLEDHQLAGQPVLPLSAALDLAAHAVEEASGSSGAPLLLRDFRLRHPIRVADAAQLTVSVGGSGELGVSLSAAVDGAPAAFARAPAYTAFATPAADVGSALSSALPAPAATGAPELPMTLDEFYGGFTFHGPRMRAIESIEQISPQGIVGQVRTSKPADWIRNPRRSSWTVDPLAVDGAFQLAAYWAWSHLKRAGFPVGIEEFVQVAPLGEGPVRASLTLEQSTGDEVRGTIVLQSREGRVVAVARGVQGEFKHRDPRFLIGRTAPLKPLTPAPEPKPLPVDEATYRIDQFPEVQELEQRLGLATAFGLRNPYFNVHERVTNDTSVIGGRTVINWSSYNYLGFSGDANVTRAAQEAVARYGTSVSASRVASGEKPLHRELEQELAAFLGTEDSVVTVSGHGVFVTTIATLMKDGDLVLHDALAHDCIMTGAKLSGAKRRPFPHNDWRSLEKQLQQLRPHYRRVLIAIEGVYSMDGDFPELPKFIELKKKYGCLLLVDEAHSIGVMGRTGAGIGEHFGVNRADVDLWMGTLSKSFASCGGYVCGTKQLVQFLKYTAGGFVYSVGISPANTAAALEALRQLKAHPEKVARLHERASLFLRLAKEKGIDTGFSQESAVIPAILGNSLHALSVSDALKHRGINVQPILYPAVEETAARLRFFCTATHTEQQIRETVQVLAEEIARARAESGESASSDSATGST